MTSDNLVRDMDPGQCLSTTWCLDFDHIRVSKLANRLCEGLDHSEYAARLFRFVRDEIRYEFRAKLNRDEYKASYILQDAKGFCVQKAIALCALSRAVNIPAAIVLADLRDHTLPPSIVEALDGHDTLFYHGLSALYVKNKWLLADATLSPELVARKGYQLVEFDGTADALISPTRLDGSPHADYVNFHGFYSDLPFQQMLERLKAAYRGANIEALTTAGYEI